MTADTISAAAGTSAEADRATTGQAGLTEDPDPVPAGRAQDLAGASSGCCPPLERASCCEPVAKAACCGAAVPGTCGCRSGGGPTV
jgi:hypothetical protein